jgi:hypothetical protein
MAGEQKSPIFAIFHPQGGRKVINVEELAEHELRVLHQSGWKESPLEFWSPEEVAEKAAAGFFNREHEWERKYESSESSTNHDRGSVEDIKAADAARGQEEQAVSLHSEEADNRDRSESDGQGNIGSGDPVSISERPLGVPERLEEVPSVVSEVVEREASSPDRHEVQPRAGRTAKVSKDAGKRKGR